MEFWVEWKATKTSNDPHTWLINYGMSLSIPLGVSCLCYCSFIRHGTKGRASKAFITQDLAGTSFLCYLLGQLNKLR